MADVQLGLVYPLLLVVVGMRQDNLSVAVALVLMKQLARLVPIVLALVLHVLPEQALRRVPMVAATDRVFLHGHRRNQGLSLVKSFLDRILSYETLDELLVELPKLHFQEFHLLLIFHVLLEIIPFLT